MPLRDPRIHFAIVCASISCPGSPAGPMCRKHWRNSWTLPHVPSSTTTPATASTCSGRSRSCRKYSTGTRRIRPGLPGRCRSTSRPTSATRPSLRCSPLTGSSCASSLRLGTEWHIPAIKPGHDEDEHADPEDSLTSDPPRSRRSGTISIAVNCCGRQASSAPARCCPGPRRGRRGSRRSYRRLASVQRWPAQPEGPRRTPSRRSPATTISTSSAPARPTPPQNQAASGQSRGK